MSQAGRNGKGMCPVDGCGSPREAGQSYCSPHSRSYVKNYTKQRRVLSRRLSLGGWKRSTPETRAAPTDWREVLRKAEEPKA